MITRRSSGRVIVVTGSPGTGKTIFAKRLAKRIGANYIPLTKFISKHKLYMGFDRERKARVVDLTRAHASMRNVLSRSTGLTVVDTHIPEGIIPKEVVKRVFVLRCHPRILEMRLGKRKWKPSKVRENVLAEMLDSCLTAAVECYGWGRVTQLDTSHASVVSCVATAERTLRKPAGGRAKIDWIATLEKEHLLDRYLR